MLHWYSIRMINNMWLSKDGKRVEIEFMNAFSIQETRTFTIRDFGYLQSSRLFGCDTLTHKQVDTLYINFNRNNYAAFPEYENICRAIFSGKEIVTSAGAVKDSTGVDIVRKAKKYAKQ